jgi:polyisoprenoid-binding protein YceI
MMAHLKPVILSAAIAVATFLAPAALVADEAKLAAPSGTYKMDPTHASLVWKVNHFGLSNYTARFTKFDVKLQLDVDHIEKSSVTATIDAASVKTDYPGKADFDGEIANTDNFLQSATFPTIEFVSRSIEKTGEKTALIHGDVTILGIRKPVTLKATLNGMMAAHPYAKVPAVGFHAEGFIQRSAFGIDYLIPYVGDDISFVIEAEFIKAD